MTTRSVNPVAGSSTVLPVPAALAAELAGLPAVVFASVGSLLFHTGSRVPAPVGAVPPAPKHPPGSVSPSKAAPAVVSTFEVLGSGVDELGNQSQRGYAFVIHSGPQSSDLLTDYDLVVGDFVQGYDIVEVQRGAHTFTAKVVSVSPDPHVALLRISGTHPSLPISTRRPAVGDTVVLGESGTTAARPAAAVIAEGLRRTDPPDVLR